MWCTAWQSELFGYSGKLPLSSAEACCGEAGEKENESAGSIFSIISIFIRIPWWELLRRRERKLHWQDWVCWNNPSERFNISNEAGGLICWSMTTRVAYIAQVIISLMRLIWYRRSHDSWAFVPYACMRKNKGKKRNKQFIKKMKLLRNVSKLKYMENNWFYS